MESLFILKKKNGDALAAVRCISVLRVAEVEDEFWLRASLEEEDFKKVIALPLSESYEVQENLLFVKGNKVPLKRLPELEWKVIAEVCSVEIPLSAAAAKSDVQLKVSLIRSDDLKESVALLAFFPLWKDYCSTAPATRLQALRFAVSDDYEALIMGKPLPPVPGDEYYKEGRFLLPVGFCLEYPFSLSIVNELIGGEASDLILFSKDGTYSKLPATVFVPAKRSAVRLTQ